MWLGTLLTVISHVRPENQPTIPNGTVKHKRVGHPWFKISFGETLDDQNSTIWVQP
jgi:hypothetical protein